MDFLAPEDPGRHLTDDGGLTQAASRRAEHTGSGREGDEGQEELGQHDGESTKIRRVPQGSFDSRPRGAFRALHSAPP